MNLKRLSYSFLWIFLKLIKGWKQRAETLATTSRSNSFCIEYVARGMNKWSMIVYLSTSNCDNQSLQLLKCDTSSCRKREGGFGRKMKAFLSGYNFSRRSEWRKLWQEEDISMLIQQYVLSIYWTLDSISILNTSERIWPYDYSIS